MWVDPGWLTQHGVREWTELPLWRTRAGVWRVNSSHAQAAGLRCRPLRQTIADTMRSIKPDIEVLYMSGYAQPVLTSRGALHRNEHLIEKPFSAAKLIARAAQIINSRR